MCELCSDDPQERIKAKKQADRIAEALERAAASYRALAHGTIKPHTKEFSDIQYSARAAIRYLVHDWV